MTKQVRWALVAIAAVVATTSGSHAYTLKSTKWNTSQVGFYVNPQNLDLPEAEIVAAVQYGAYTWTNQTNAAFAFTYSGSTNGTTAENNGRNEVFFRNASNGSAIATTYTWSSNGRTLDTDIVFWDQAFTFFTGASGCSGGLYVEDIAAHEFGHALGLGHSTVSGATMMASVSYCSQELRSLSEDDKQGVEAIYPSGSGSAPAPNSPPSVTISSPVSSTTAVAGQAISFSGAASDAQDGDISAGLVWVSNLQGQLGTGRSFQQTLSAGTHTITAKATDTAGATGESSQTIVVASGSTSGQSTGFTLSGKGYKLKGLQRVDLTWTGTAAQSIDVYRDGVRLTSTLNTGRYSDGINKKGSGSYTYVVCEAGSATCSNQIKVTF